MNLGEIESRLLIELQQPGLTSTPPLGAPNWAGLTNPPPAYNQAVVDFTINKAYERVIGDTAHLQIITASFVVNTVQFQFQYTINPPPAGNPNVGKIYRVRYTPTGLNYTFELRPGGEFVSWSEFLENTGNLYYLQTAAASSTIPSWVTVGPGRTQLWFYPASNNTTDTFTLIYCPLPTVGAAQCPTLVAAVDTPLLPQDCHEAIVQAALIPLWAKARQFQARDTAVQMYNAEIARIKSVYGQAHPGDTLMFSGLDDTQVPLWM